MCTMLCYRIDCYCKFPSIDPFPCDVSSVGLPEHTHLSSWLVIRNNLIDNGWHLEKLDFGFSFFCLKGGNRTIADTNSVL